jgi:PAS domain S-box-containing protein
MRNRAETNRYKLPAALLERVTKLALERPNEIFSVWGADLRCYYASPSTTSIPGGYTQEEMLGRKASEFVHVSDFAHMALAKSDTELTGKSIEMSVDVRNKFGDRIRVRSRTELLRDESSGKVFFLTRTVPADQKLSE